MEGVFDPNYEYDAPMFVDFSTGLKEDPSVDSWFDAKGGVDCGFEEDSLMEEDSEPPAKDSDMAEESEQKTEEKVSEVDEKSTPPEPQNGLITNSDKEEVHQVEKTSKSEPESDPSKQPENDFTTNVKPQPAARKLPNIVTSLSWSKTFRAQNQASAQPKPAAKHKMSAPKPEAKSSEEPPAKKTRGQESPTMLTRSKLEAARAPRRSHRLSRKRTDSVSSTMSTRSDGNTSVFSRNTSIRKSTRKAMPKTKMPMLTIPSTPTMMKRQKTKPAEPVKAIEELELEEISKLQKALKEKRKQNEQFMKKSLNNPAYKPCRSVEDPTHATEFHFATDSRIKSNPAQNCPEAKEKNFFDTLRQHPQSPSFKNRGPTKPQPFSFDKPGHKRKHEGSNEDLCEGYVSMAQRCYSFQSKTPPRFRTKKAMEQNDGPPPCQSDRRSGSKLTCPKTPNLTSNDRKRPLAADCLSREQQEKKIVEEMKNYKFQAKEFDPKIVEKQGNYGVKPQPVKALTELQPFNLTTDQRGDVYKQKEQESLLEEKPAPFKAQPVPEYNKMEFKPELPHQATVQQPFSFEERNKEINAKKEQKIKELLEEERKAREFKAQPLRSFSPVGLPTASRLQATKFEPFNLETENRGVTKADTWIKMVQNEMQEERKKVVFKAHSSNVLYKPAFVPKKSLKPTTVFDNFTLNSDRRAEERAIYDMHKHEKEMEVDALQRQREAERQEEEKQNIAMLRKQMVHKHNPIRKYKNVDIGPSDRPLTVPESPVWHTRERKNIRI